MGLISWMLLLSGVPALLLSVFPVSDKATRLTGIVASLSVLLLSFFLLAKFSAGNADFQFVEKVSWIPELGISYEVGVDGISLFLILLTAISTAAVIFSSANILRIKAYISLFLFLELSLIGVFVALDLILFFVFFELMLLPGFLLINGWGGGQAFKAGIRFVIFTACGSALMLSSIIYLGWLTLDQTGQPSYSLTEISQSVNLSPELEGLLFLGFFLAFAIKTPIAPLHNWLPRAYTQAPSGFTAFMSAVMAKAGLYGIIRFSWSLFPSALNNGIFDLFNTGVFSHTWLAAVVLRLAHQAGDMTSLFLWIIAAGVIYTALIAWSQRNAKTLLAYSSVSHLSVCALGIVVCSSASLSAAVFFMLAHGLVSLGLFLSLDSLCSRVGSFEIVNLSGVVSYLPKISVLFFLFLLGAVSLPLTANFVAEFAILFSVFEEYPAQTILASLSVIFGAVYIFSMFRRFISGPQQSSLSRVEDLSIRELLVLAPLIALIFALGIFPSAVLKRIQPAADKISTVVSQSKAVPYDSEDHFSRERIEI